jgi:amino acid transporter
MQIIIVVWLGWTGFAAKQGPTQLVLWLLALAFFYVPLAAVVIKLSRAMPVEGGVYQWVKNGVSPFAGYMAGWNLTIYVMMAFCVVGSVLAEALARAVGPSGEWMLTNRPFTLSLMALACAIAFVMNVRGLQVAKWCSNFGALLTVATFFGLFFLLVKAFVEKAPLFRSSYSLAWPALSVLTLAVFAKVAVGALSGFDMSAIFAEECRKPENDVARSVMIAAPSIALMYILGTSAVLAYLPPAAADVSAAVPQVMQTALGFSALGRASALLVAVAFDVAFTAQLVICVGMVARMPMVAGWDNLLPPWWSTLHPKFRTPSRAITAVTVCLLVLGTLALWRADNQEAVQVGASVGIASLSIMYMLLFSVVLVRLRSTAWNLGAGMKIGALCAFAVALVSLVFQIVPVGEVASSAIYAVKVGGAIAAANGLGAFLYWRGAKRAQSLASNVEPERVAH